MKRPRLVLVLVLLCVLVYLTFLKRHYDSQIALPLKLPPGPAPRAHLAPDWTAGSEEWVRFGIMFDAGSTGTRVHIFKFRLDYNKSEVPELLGETFKAIKPGLSAFADDPPQCRGGLLELLDLARATVPVQFWKSTPVFLKATAGLRLLQGEQADRLLDQVRALFRSSPFLSADDSVSVLDGTDEGISAWVTVNFLLGALPAGGATASVGMLDLGGGSTQVTFRPRPQDQDSVRSSPSDSVRSSPSDSVRSSPSDSVRSFRLFRSSYSLYTHSYLGLGLMSARAAVLGGTSPAPAGGAVLVSPCLSPDFSGSWEHNHVSYSLRGQRTGEDADSGFLACSERVQLFLKNTVRRVWEQQQQFFAFSFYYDRAVDIRAIDEKTGGEISAADYITAARRVCAGEVLSPDQSPFLCLDLVYISVLLQELGFPPHTQLKLVRTIGDVETSWALGATFLYMNL